MNISPTERSGIISAVAVIVEAISSGEISINDAYWAAFKCIQVDGAVLRAGGRAWDFREPQFAAHRPAFDAIVDQIAQIEADEAAARAAAEAYAIAHSPVPASVTRRQLFLWLLDQKAITRAQVRAMIATEAGLIEFDEALEFRRDHPLVAQLAQALSMSADDTDTAFRAAALL